MLCVAFCTIMAISLQKEARSRDYTLLLFRPAYCVWSLMTRPMQWDITISLTSLLIFLNYKTLCSRTCPVSFSLWCMTTVDKNNMLETWFSSVSVESAMYKNTSLTEHINKNIMASLDEELYFTQLWTICQICENARPGAVCCEKVLRSSSRSIYQYSINSSV